jgi:P27 family predicted phage terminase small subunit
MTKGRKPENPKIKWLRGNPGKRNIPSEPKLPVATIKYPDWINEEAISFLKSIETDLKELGLLTPLDRTAFFMLGVAFARMVEAQRLIEEYGLIIKGHRNAPRKHPAHMILSQAESQFIKLAAEFGLSPASRHRLRFTPVDKTENSYQKWKNNKNSSENEEIE